MMQFRDLQRQYQALKASIDENISAVIHKANFIAGSQVQQLEERLALYTGRRHCITCGNGTDALELMLRAWEIGPGDAVFVPDFTFFASAETVVSNGATPIFVDVSEGTFNMDPAKLERAAAAIAAAGNLRPKAVLAVDLFGLPADYAAIEAVANQYGLLVLEDAAQSFGASLNGQKACSFGKTAITSFFPAKPLGCYGDGGAIFTDDDDKAALLRSLAVHGKGTDKYDNVRIGRNSRLDTLQAAVLLAKLDALDEEVKWTDGVAEFYTRSFEGLVATPAVAAGYASAWAQYTIRLRDGSQRDSLKAALHANGVPSVIYYPKTMSQQLAFESFLPQQVDDCKTAQTLCSQVLSLPIHPYLEQDELQQVVQTIQEYIE